MSTIAMPTRQSSIWWVFLLQGVAGILLGLMLLTDPGATLIVLVTFLGFYWLFTGVMALVRVFVDRSVPWIWSLLIGIVGIFAGLVVLHHPLLAALTVPAVIVIVLGVQGLIMGVLDIIGGFTGGGHRLVLPRRDQFYHRRAAARRAVDSGARGPAGVRHAAADPGHRADHPGAARPHRVKRGGRMKSAKPLVMLVALLAAPAARAQVTVDVSKITCEQFLGFSVADPRDIAIWLSGYYHGKQGITVLEPQTLKQNAEKLKTACFKRDNSKLPVMQVIEKDPARQIAAPISCQGPRVLRPGGGDAAGSHRLHVHHDLGGLLPPAARSARRAR